MSEAHFENCALYLSYAIGKLVV